MISCCHAAVSLNCSILATPWLTNIIWYSFSPFFFPLLLPSVHQLSLLPSSVPLRQPCNSPSGPWLSNSPGYKSVLTKFTSKLTSLVLESSSPVSVLSVSLGYIWSSSPATLPLSMCSFWSEAQTVLSHVSSLRLYLQAGCHHQPWGFGAHRGLKFIEI